MTPDTTQNSGPNSNYNASSIVVLEGLQAVRLRPAMYVGSTGAAGVMQLVVEVLQNSLDEALSGRAQRIDVSVDADGTWTISDDGGGIPVEPIAMGGPRPKWS